MESGPEQQQEARTGRGPQGPGAMVRGGMGERVREGLLRPQKGKAANSGSGITIRTVFGFERVLLLKRVRTLAVIFTLEMAEAEKEGNEEMGGLVDKGNPRSEYNQGKVPIRPVGVAGPRRNDRSAYQLETNNNGGGWGFGRCE